jgi:hypothetical protein
MAAITAASAVAGSNDSGFRSRSFRSSIALTTGWSISIRRQRTGDGEVSAYAIVLSHPRNLGTLGIGRESVVACAAHGSS